MIIMLLLNLFNILVNYLLFKFKIYYVIFILFLISFGYNIINKIEFL